MVKFNLPLRSEIEKPNFADHLSDDFLIHIFSLLEIGTLLICKEVSERWKNLLQTLTIYPGIHIRNVEITPEADCHLGLFKFINRPINLNTQWTVQTSSQVIENLGSRFLLNGFLRSIKHLSFSSLLIENAQTLFYFESTINSFQNLEHLQIQKFHLYHLDSNNIPVIPRLSLINIKIFSVLIFNGNKLRLDTPIQMLCWYAKMDQLVLSNPASIRHLDLWDYSENLSQFINADHIFFRCEKLSIESVHQIISCFRRANQINFPLLTCKEAKAAILKLYELRLFLTLKVYFNDFLITDLKELNLLYNNLTDEEKTTTDNLLNFGTQLAQPSTYIHELNYSTYVGQYEINDTFWSRFVNIQHVIVNMELDKSGVNGFQSFLKNCKLLNTLEIKNALFDQRFYDDLHLYCYYLTRLAIVSDQQLIYKFDFLSKFNYLDTFEINREFNFKKYLDIMQNMIHLKVFGFLLKNKWVYIDYRELTINFSSTFQFRLNDPAVPENLIQRTGRFVNAINEIFDLFADHSGPCPSHMKYHQCPFATSNIRRPNAGQLTYQQLPQESLTYNLTQCESFGDELSIYSETESTDQSLPTLPTQRALDTISFEPNILSYEKFEDLPRSPYLGLPINIPLNQSINKPMHCTSENSCNQHLMQFSEFSFENSTTNHLLSSFDFARTQLYNQFNEPQTSNQSDESPDSENSVSFLE